MGGVTPSKNLAPAAGLAAVGIAAGALACLACRQPQSVDSKGIPPAATSVKLETANTAPSIEAKEVKAVASVKQRNSSQTEWTDKLVYAAAFENPEEVHALLKRQPRGPVTNAYDYTADLSGTDGGDILIATAVYMASLKGRAEILAALLKAGANPDVLCRKFDANIQCTENETALVVACREGHEHCIKILLSAKADPNVECESGYYQGSDDFDSEGKEKNAETFHYTALDVTIIDDITDLLRKHGAESSKLKKAEEAARVCEGFMNCKPDNDKHWK